GWRTASSRSCTAPPSRTACTKRRPTTRQCRCDAGNPCRVMTGYIPCHYPRRSDAMAKEAVFTMKLEPELRDAFMAAAQRVDRPASQIVREMMRDFVQNDKAYVEFLHKKVEHARADIAAGRVYTQEEIEEEVRERAKK